MVRLPKIENRRFLARILVCCQKVLALVRIVDPDSLKPHPISWTAERSEFHVNPLEGLGQVKVVALNARVRGRIRQLPSPPLPPIPVPLFLKFVTLTKFLTKFLSHLP